MPVRPLMQTKGPGGRPKEKVTHRDICRTVASISANLRCGNTDKARTHARQLVHYLVELELIAPRNES